MLQLGVKPKGTEGAIKSEAFSFSALIKQLRSEFGARSMSSYKLPLRQPV